MKSCKQFLHSSTFSDSNHFMTVGPGRYTRKFIKICFPVIKNPCNRKLYLESCLYLLSHYFLMHYICSICNLYNWRYKKLGNLPHVDVWPDYRTANPGFHFDFQLINVEDFNGIGESEPNPYFYQVCLVNFCLIRDESKHCLKSILE